MSLSTSPRNWAPFLIKEFFTKFNAFIDILDYIVISPEPPKKISKGFEITM